MQPQSNPISNGKAKVETNHLPTMSINNVVGSSSRPPRFAVGNGEEQDVKMKMPMPMAIPLLPPPPTSSILLAPPPPETRKATLNLDKAIEYELKHGRKLDPKMDRKKLRRTVSNRLSAQRSRVKKAQHIHEMERRVTELEDMISVLTIRVQRYKEKKRLLQLQNEALERLVEIRRNEANLSQMVLEKNQAELARLKEVEKELLKEVMLRQQQQASCSGLMYGNEQVVVVHEKQGGGVAMDEDNDPFLNFHA